MSANEFANPFLGSWTYTSFINNPGSVPPAVFGAGTIALTASAMNALAGTIGGQGWGLNLNGSISYGNPNEVRFQGTGENGGENWVYDYIGYLVPIWPNGVDQVAASSEPCRIPTATAASPRPALWPRSSPSSNLRPSDRLKRRPARLSLGPGEQGERRSCAPSCRAAKSRREVQRRVRCHEIPGHPQGA